MGLTVYEVGLTAEEIIGAVENNDEYRTIGNYITCYRH